MCTLAAAPVYPLGAGSIGAELLLLGMLPLPPSPPPGAAGLSPLGMAAPPVALARHSGPGHCTVVAEPVGYGGAEAAPVDGETGVLPGDWLPAPPQSSPSQADGAGEVLPEPPQSAPLQADGAGAGAGCSVLPVGACTCPSEI